MPTFAAVDIGSNSVRLKIARLVRRRLAVVHEEREVTRLGQAVFDSGLLDPSAMAHTIEVLKRFHKTAQKKGAHSVRVVATSALREARNSRAFLDWVQSTTGWTVDIITGLEEARLIHLGIRSGLHLSSRPVLLIDLGGGSCELTISVGGHIRYTASLPLGAVRLTQEFLKHDPPTQRELERLNKLITRELARSMGPITRWRPRVVLATSGTAAALAAVCSRTKKGKRRSRGMATRNRVRKVAARLAKLKIAERTELQGVGPRRAEIIVAGAAVYAQVLEHGRLPGFRYSPLGLRDGLLEQMAADYDRRTRSRRQIESDRWDSILAIGRSYHADLKHAKRVQGLVVQLFRRLRSVHGMPADYEEWLTAAAMLHEVGIYVNRFGWHRHTYYLIVHSEIFGYTTYERQLVATIARYLGNSRPSPVDRIMKALAQRDRMQVPKAVALLRVARALNQSRRSTTRDVGASRHKDAVNIQLKTGGGTRPDLELWALNKERGYFREVFGRELRAELS